MKIKVSEASRFQLNWLVAKADGYDEGWLLRQAGNPNPETRAIPDYSVGPECGQPIIEREFIDTYHMETEGPVWEAEIQTGPRKRIKGRGRTALMAAMRCYVVSKLGEEVEVPNELL